MNSKIILKALSVKARQCQSVVKKLAKSYVSLFLVLILGVTSTLAWFSEHESARISTNNLEFQSASSLRINKDDSSFNRISIPAFKLDEASSYDGRNVYFPVGCSFTEETANMFFREANAGDGYRDTDYSSDPEHRSYVYKDFDLKGTSGETAVYIKSYRITVSTDGDVKNDGIDGVYEDQLKINYDSNGVPQNQILPPDNCPIRLAFISDSGRTPIVIDPSAQMKDYVENTDAVYLTNDDGSPVPNSGNTQVGIRTTNADSFASYYYKNTPLFSIPGGHDLNVTLVVWLEGTMGNCDKYIGKQIDVDIDIESNFAAMETITFIDGTAGDSGSGDHWVANDNPIIACSYEDPFSEENPKRWKTVIMSRMTTDSNSDDYYSWTCQIPKKAVQNISFYRLSKPADTELEGTIYNAWHTSPNISKMIANSQILDNWYQTGKFDLQTSRQMTDSDNNTYNSTVYTAVHGNGRGVTDNAAYRLAPCVGYWDYSGTSGGGSSGGGESGGGESGGGSSKYDIKVHVETTEQTWIDTNCTQNGSTLWFNTSGGQQKELDRLASNSFEWSGSLDANDEITSFEIKNSTGNQYVKWTASPTFVVTSNYNVNYYVNRDNNLMIRQ